MAKIQAQAGDSLADIYDVKGSIAGIDELMSREIFLTHEMGAAVFAERFSVTLHRMTSGAIAQSVNFDVVDDTLAEEPTRIVGACVFSDAGARVSRAALFVRDSGASRELPVWIYDGTNMVPTRMEDNAGGVGLFDVLLAAQPQTMVPQFAGGRGQLRRVSALAFRGASTAFGAGTVIVNVLTMLAWANIVGGVSSRGLPIPSW